MIRKPVFFAAKNFFFYKKKIFWNFSKHGHNGQTFDNQNKREKTITFQCCLESLENCIVWFLCSLKVWPIQYFVDKDVSAILYLKLCHAYAFKTSHEEHFQMVKKEIVIKKAFPVYFQPMCDLIITNVRPICPTTSQTQEWFCCTLSHSLWWSACEQQKTQSFPRPNKKKKSHFFSSNESKQACLFCNVYSYEQWYF